ncbi:hypothetical protein [Flavobacterium sp. ACAM 123]|uniref:hypothetical protein n=1 Tax=Flavobacterium sp. ACAM 123 TaxID=1189620 RepID=UPI00030AC0F4|nr:hypothetical protein [Flavobacterium sp. ACAM 123]
MNNSTSRLISLIVLLLFYCVPKDISAQHSNTQKTSPNVFSKPSRITTNIWNFNNLNQWQDASLNGAAHYSIINGNLKLFSSAGTWERTKVKTISNFGVGTYTWNIYIPAMGIGDKASIGAFLYHNDKHEIDYEIGYGTQSKRTELKAQTDDLILYMTSQGNPYHSEQIKIKREAWYTLTIDLRFNSRKHYIANWKINGITRSTAQLNYGKNKKFNIFCSVENLHFIGDHIPTIQNYALVDWVEFKVN